MMFSIEHNLHQVNDRIAEALRHFGRPADSVKLIAVSKTHPADAVADAINCGQKVFGESRVQEALDKKAALAAFRGNQQDVEWHLIGHLQTNKAKFVPTAFQWVHTIDSLELARKISDAAIKAGVVCNGLIQVNVANDPAKHGIDPHELDPLVDSMLEAELGGLALRGLMTIGRLDVSESETRKAFARLRGLRDKLQQSFNLPGFTELSMGMSGDYPIAIEEGATMVRVGSAIFGERGYPQAR